MDEAPDVCDALREMSELTEPTRGLESEVIAPDPPEAFTAYELISLQRLTQASQRRSARRAQKNVDTGRARHFVGGDADAIKAENLRVLEGKVEEWIYATWAPVWAAMVAEGADPAYEAEAMELWIEETRLEGSRLGRLHPPEGEAEAEDASLWDEDGAVWGEGDTVGEARWKAKCELERRLGASVDPGRVEYVTLEEGVRGLLGVGQEPARVLARMRAA